MVLKNVSSNFTNTKDLVYTVIRNGRVLIDSQPIPTSDTTILKGQQVGPNGKNEYEVYYKYLETGTSQDVDLGKNYKAEIFITAE